MKKLGVSIIGVLLIILGVMLAMSSFGYLNINLFFDGWWTLFLIIPSLVDIINKKDINGNLITLTIGILLLLVCQDILSFSTIFKLFIPVLIIIAGVVIIFKDAVKKDINKEIKKLNSKKDDDNEYYSTFSDQKISFDNEKLKSMDANAIFGALNLDLSNAEVKEDITINTFAVFGGIDISLPKDAEVIVKSNSLFGGVENKLQKDSKKDLKKDLPKIYVNSVCLFGGVKLK